MKIKKILMIKNLIVTNQYLIYDLIYKQFNPTQAIQYYVIKFVSDLRQISGFFRFPPPIN
jgi:hypothetical protein